jgi:hypothetical protein
MTPQMAEYILGLYKFKLDLADKVMEGAKTEEAWMRSKERLRGAPIDWTKVIDRSYFDKAIAMK